MDSLLRAVPILEQDQASDSGLSYSTLVDAEVPVVSTDVSFSPSASSSVTTTIQSLRERFICTHSQAKTARKRHEQVHILEFVLGGATTRLSFFDSLDSL